MLPVANRARRPPAGGGLGSLRNLGADARWAALGLPTLARRLRADLVHHPLPSRARLPGIPQVVTVADLAFERLPECFDRRFRAYAHLAHRAAARRAAAVVCVSETTAADVRELWGIPAQRIVVAAHGPGQALAPRAGGAAAHFLYVGDAEPRKNLGRLLAGYDAYRRRAPAPLPLVLAGSARAAAPGVRVEPRPDAELLAGLYGAAAALVAPSLYEGFGLTVLEAMSAGIPVLAARSPGLLEVGGDAVLWADPLDPESFAEGLARLHAEPALRARLGERGRGRAREFSWSACARAHLRAYSLALGRAPAHSTS